MANLGLEIHNSKVDDVLTPRRQAEIAAVTAHLLRFKPRKVMAEWSAGSVAERYKSYLDGAHRPRIISLSRQSGAGSMLNLSQCSYAPAPRYGRICEKGQQGGPGAAEG
jgi:hypothetical protein